MAALRTVATLLRGLYPALSKGVKRSIAGSAKSVRTTTRRRTSSALDRLAGRAPAAGLEGAAATGTTAARKGFIRRHPIITGLAGVGTAFGINEASPSFLGGESLTLRISDLVTGKTPRGRAEAQRVREQIVAQQQLLLDRDEEAQLEALGRGELAAASQGINPQSLSKSALQLLSRRDAGTRLFGTQQEGLAVINALFGPNAQSPIRAGLSLEDIAQDVGRDIPLLRLLSRGERARLAEASRAPTPSISQNTSKTGGSGTLRQVLAEGAALGGLGG